MKYFNLLLLLIFLSFSQSVFSQSCELYVPNSFTPNSDGYNDTWEVSISDSCYFRYECKIYDRYGSLIWYSRDPFDRWQGNVIDGSHYAQSGLYQYLIIINREDRADKYIGSIKLVR
jgi:gliding motility-associated-like protein